MKVITAEPVDIDFQLHELARLVKERFGYQIKLYLGGQITIDRLIAAYDQLENIERRAARSSSQHIAVRERALKWLRGIETIAETEVKNGRLPVADLSEFQSRRKQLEIDQTNAGKEESVVSAMGRRLQELERTVEQLEKRVRPDRN